MLNEAGDSEVIRQPDTLCDLPVQYGQVMYLQVYRSCNMVNQLSSLWSQIACGVDCQTGRKDLVQFFIGIFWLS